MATGQHSICSSTSPRFTTPQDYEWEDLGEGIFIARQVAPSSLPTQDRRETKQRENGSALDSSSAQHTPLPTDAERERPGRQRCKTTRHTSRGTNVEPDAWDIRTPETMSVPKTAGRRRRSAHGHLAASPGDAPPAKRTRRGREGAVERTPGTRSGTIAATTFVSQLPGSRTSAQSAPRTLTANVKRRVRTQPGAALTGVRSQTVAPEALALSPSPSRLDASNTGRVTGNNERAIPRRKRLIPGSAPEVHTSSPVPNSLALPPTITVTEFEAPRSPPSMGDVLDGATPLRRPPILPATDSSVASLFPNPSKRSSKLAPTDSFNSLFSEAPSSVD
ncbi:uncharacterized protein C8Q71DRAFT_846021 [Rhodofomes roseus]|uniref:Uncharacterized protein n=1 Tax=Rhodofomes roseus TaxID=34475 RepID=A0ABQ8KPW1_9APHY|nr:uncharacterized protein C8Q71DRAFT_846021 [Rhodofomes roseus]KAH9840651.1 hypothetical protein C8Q71DRAFT_846021 [Rhodofomes roseus]